LDHKQIEDLYLKIQEFKSADNWSVKAGDQVQTLVQLLPLTESGL
jgi:hypothetical protein